VPFISYGDYLGANKNEVANMEDQLRQEEQKQLSQALQSTNAAGAQAKDDAYWGGSGDVNDYAAWKESEQKRTAAREFQNDIQNDAGQLNQLNKIGKGYSSLDAAFALGSNKSEKTRASLAEYMGYDSNRLEELASKYGEETEAARKDFDRESGLMDESRAKDDAFAKHSSARKASEDEYWAAIESKIKSTVTPASDDEWRKFHLDRYMGKNPEMPNGGASPDDPVAHYWQLYSGQKGAPYMKGDRSYLAAARDQMLKSGRLGMPSIGDISQSVMTGKPARSNMASLEDYLRSKGQDGAAPEQGNYKGRLRFGRSGWGEEQDYRNKYGELGGLD
jgi:hypothetical protein